MRKRIAVSLILLSVIFLMLAFCGCTPDVKLEDPKVVSLAVDGVVTTGYITGNELDISNAKLFVTYDNDEIKVVDLEKSMLDPTSYSMHRPGKQTVVVRYEGGTTTFDIYVQGLELEYVELQSEPYVTDYVVGQSIDLAGAKIRMFFKQSETSFERKYEDISVTEDMLEAYERNNIGTQTIYLNYADTRLSFDVNYTDKTPISIKIVDPATNNFVFVGLGQYTFFLTTSDGERLNKVGEKVEKAQTYYYSTYVNAASARETLMAQNKESGYLIELKNRFDLSGMSVRIGFDNDQTPKYDVVSGESTELDSEGEKLYADISDLADHIYVSIDDSTQNTVEAVLLYLPEDYPEEFVYHYYGKAYVEVGGYVTPGMEISSNSMERDGQKITLNSVTSKSYGVVKSISTDPSGKSTIRVSASVDYSMTDVSVKEGDIVKHNAPIGMRGKTTIFSVGGGIVTAIKNGVVTIRTAPTTFFTSKAEDKSFKSISLVNVDGILPKLYPDITTTDNMIQGDTIDLESGVINYVNPDGSVTERGPVRIDYNDGSYEFFKLSSSYISIVNAGAETTGDGLDISRAGRHELWIVYGGEINYRVSFYVTVEQRYPVRMMVVSSTNTISGSRFYYEDTIPVTSIKYYIVYNNGDNEVVDDNTEFYQLTEDMLVDDGNNYSLYCASAPSAYLKDVRFTLREEDLKAIPEGVNRNIYSEIFTCKVLPRPIHTSELTILEDVKKVYVTNDDNIDFTGAIYQVEYQDNVYKTLDGKDIEEYKGRDLPMGGSTSLLTAVGDEETSLYLDTRTYRLYVDDGSSPVPVSELTRIGVRKVATLIYKDFYYSDFNAAKENEDWNIYQPGDLFQASTTFYYYLINNSDWAVTGMKVTLSYSSGIKDFKDVYSQYEDWDLTGVSISLTTIDYSSGATATSVIPATREMIYDSTTNRLVTDIPVKFYFLGFSDDDTLHIRVKKRQETSLELVTTGKDTYLLNIDNEPDFSDYELYMHYNAGPIDVVKNLENVKRHNPREREIEDGWWYSIYSIAYAVYDISEEETEEGRFVDEESAELFLSELQASHPNRQYVMRTVEGNELGGFPEGEGYVYIRLNHSVKDEENDEDSTRVSVLLQIELKEYDNIIGVTYIGVEGKYYAGYGTGQEYVIVDKFNQPVALDVDGNVIGSINSNGSFSLPSVRVYFASEEAATEALTRLITYNNDNGDPIKVKKETKDGREVTTYYIVNANGTGVNTSGEVGDIYFYEDRQSAENNWLWLKNNVTEGKIILYTVARDVTTQKYVIKDSKGRTLTSEGKLIRNYFATESDAYVYSDALNGIARKDVTSISSKYIIKRDGLNIKTEFNTIEDAREYLIENDLLLYSITNELYIIGEVAAGWNIMLSEFVDGVLVQKNLTIYYNDPVTPGAYLEGHVPISMDMISYNKMDSSVGYRVVTINYKNFSCNAYIYVWRAELTSVDISKYPLQNYIRDTEELDLQEGILQLTFTKYSQQNTPVGIMRKYISMEDPDVHCSEFYGNVYSKSGTKQTINVTYKDYEALSTSFSVYVYDKQDVSFTISGNTYFYGNVSDAGYTTKQEITEFTMPDDEDIRMYYVEKKNFIPYKQYKQLGYTDDDDNFMPITVKDADGNLSTLFYIRRSDVKYTVEKTIYVNGVETISKTLPFYSPASGSYYAIYSAYAKIVNGVVVDRCTEVEYNAIESEEEKALWTPVQQGDILYMYDELGYKKLSLEENRLCQLENNNYYILIAVTGNKYYETRNYCLDDYKILPHVSAVTVMDRIDNAYRLRVTTENNSDAILYLLKTDNMNSILKDIPTQLNVTEEYFNGRISEVALISPNTDYFELMVAYSSSDLNLIAGIYDCILDRLRSAVSIRNIYIGNDKVKYTDLQQTEIIPAIKNAMRQKINAFEPQKEQDNYLSLQSDTEYQISYKMVYGETYTKKDETGKNVLELFSGQLYLDRKGDGKFTVVVGTLGHPSYTIDLETKTFTITDKRRINIEALAANDNDYVLRLYMDNASEVYSRWYVSGKFDAYKKDKLKNETYKYILQDVKLISPNQNYFELRFCIKENVTLTNLDDLADLAKAFVTDLSSYGAENVYFGQDAHLLTEDSILSIDGIYFYPIKRSETVFLVAKDKETSIVDYYSDFIAEINKSEYDDIRSKVSLQNDRDEYTLRVKLFEAWMGTDSEKNDFAVFLKTFYDSLLDLDENGKAYYIEKTETDDGQEEYTEISITKDKDEAFYKDIISKLGVDDDLNFSMLFKYSGSMYDFISKKWDDIADMIDSSSPSASVIFSTLIDDVTVLTRDPLSKITMSWKEDADVVLIEKIFYALLQNVNSRASHVWYGSDIICYSEEHTATLTGGMFLLSLKKGINVFDKNDKDIYDVSYDIIYYTEEEKATQPEELLHYNAVYVLPSERLVVDTSIGDDNNNVFFLIVETVEGNKVTQMVETTTTEMYEATLTSERATITTP